MSMIGPFLETTVEHLAKVRTLGQDSPGSWDKATVTVDSSFSDLIGFGMISFNGGKVKLKASILVLVSLLVHLGLQ